MMILWNENLCITTLHCSVDTACECEYNRHRVAWTCTAPKHHGMNNNEGFKLKHLNFHWFCSFYLILVALCWIREHWNVRGARQNSDHGSWFNSIDSSTLNVWFAPAVGGASIGSIKRIARKKCRASVTFRENCFNDIIECLNTQCSDLTPSVPPRAQSWIALCDKHIIHSSGVRI